MKLGSLFCEKDFVLLPKNAIYDMFLLKFYATKASKKRPLQNSHNAKINMEELC